jgi:hypothetical protein
LWKLYPDRPYGGKTIWEIVANEIADLRRKNGAMTGALDDWASEHRKVLDDNLTLRTFLETIVRGRPQFGEPLTPAMSMLIDSAKRYLAGEQADDDGSLWPEELPIPTKAELAKQLGLRSRDNLRERLAEGIADGLYESKIVWVLNSAGYRTTVPAYRCIEKGKR